ncbi:MAG: hypothetical protein ABMA14_28720, partial [Hyphomonadaceae bacterium]
MSGPHDKFDGELDELDHDFELDMDAPLGATFAAALRDRDGGLPPLEGAEFGMDDDGFLAPRSPAPEPAAPRASTVTFEEEFGDEEFGDEDGDENSGNVQPQFSQGEGQPQGGGQS